MQFCHKNKEKVSTLSRAISDPQMHKNFLQTQKLISSSRSEIIDTNDVPKDLGFTLRNPHKAIHNLNLQIPSLNTPNASATIKGGQRQISSKTLRASSLKKKNTDDYFGFKQVESGIQSVKSEKDMGEETSTEIRLLEKELKKALEENKRLKEKVQDNTENDAYIDDLMKRFKLRLYKLLYE